jgi:hypothetical protein
VCVFNEKGNFVYILKYKGLKEGKKRRPKCYNKIRTFEEFLPIKC